MHPFKPAVISLAVAISAVAACSNDQKMPDGNHPVDTAAVAHIQPPANPDRDFLREMSDHHKGLVAIVHATLDRKEKLSVRADATKLDSAQDRELDDMVTMLEKSYKDPYDPKIMPEHQAMLDSLKTLHGSAYDRAFLQDIIRHHEEALSMIEAFLPNSKDPAVKAMAVKMNDVQAKEIAQYKQQLGGR